MDTGHGGARPGAGRRTGSKNKLGSVREAFESVFALLQEDPENPASLEQWARKQPGEFYKLASKLLPMQVTAEGSLSLIVSTGIPDADPDDGGDLV